MTTLLSNDLVGAWLELQEPQKPEDPEEPPELEEMELSWEPQEVLVRLTKRFVLKRAYPVDSEVDGWRTAAKISRHRVH